VIRPTSGDVLLKGRPITRVAQAERVKLGIARTFQINRLFRGLSVLENVYIAISERVGAAPSMIKPAGKRTDVIDESMTLLETLKLADSAHLIPDTVTTKVDDDITASISYDPQQFMVGLYGHMTYHLTDTATGKAITDLQTYLGAFGHTLIMSEDMAEYVHSHPLDILAKPDDDGGPPTFVIAPGADLEKLRGGPDVTFEGLMPKPGRYRAWTQFRRHDKLHTFSVTFNVVAAAE